MAGSYSVAIICLGIISGLFCDENMKVNNLTDNNNVISCSKYEFSEKYSLIEHSKYDGWIHNALVNFKVILYILLVWYSILVNCKWEQGLINIKYLNIFSINLENS